jgi:uncharacterized protein (TIGR03546 family)
MAGANGFRRQLNKLAALNNTPPEIAWGAAIGVFIGITPLYGFHTILVLICAILVPRTNKIAILAGSNISLPVTAPFISWLGYQIGRMILGESYPNIYWYTLKHFSYRGMADLLYPLFLGSFILGIAGALASYFIILFFVTKMRARK